MSFDPVIDALATRLDRLERLAGRLDEQPGVVTQVSPLLVQLDIDSAPQPTRRLTSYTGVLNDRVRVLVVGGVDRYVLGKLA